MLKEAKQQSGVSWNEKHWMIEAEQELWDNLIISFPNIGKFHTKGFLVFMTWGIYDGQTAEGTYNFISTQRSQQPYHSQEVELDLEVSSVDITHSHSHVGETLVDARDDTQVGMQEANVQVNIVRHDEAHPTGTTTSSTSTENESRRRWNNGEVSTMMEKYIKMKTKQIENA
uniref:Uncharacterized protein n=1 Tax=Avena sativa TaxID=4498 RepID=A0ACD5YXZ0_AVESA